MINKVIQRFIPKSRKQLFLLYTVLFVVVLIGSYFPFLILNKTLIWEYDDGFLQHYEWLVYLKKTVNQFIGGNGFSFWAWSFGLGADSIGYIGGILCDPFNYVAILFPESHMDLGYTVAIWIRLYVAGIGFLWFGNVVGMRKYTRLLGALSYSFSSWLFLCSTRHDTFVTVAVLFVFLMVGVEKILRRESPIPFIAAVFFSVVTSVYFLYMSAIMIVIYVLIYFIKNERKSVSLFLELVGRFLLYGGIALLLSAIVVIPVLYTLLRAVKEGAVDYQALFDFEVYSNYLTSLVSGNEIFYHFSTFFASALFLILIPPIVLNVVCRRATTAMVMFSCCAIFLLFPVVNAAFNGFGYPAGRWNYGTTFFFVWSGLQCLEQCGSEIVKLKKVIYGFLAFLGIWLVVICRVVFGLSSEKILILGIVNIAAGFVLYQIICAINRDKKVIRNYIFLITAVIVNLSLFHTIEYFPGISGLVTQYSSTGAIYNKLNHSTQKAGLDIEDKSFYRIDQVDYMEGGEASPGFVNRPNRQVHVPANETLVFNTRSLYTYSSGIPGILHDLSREVCNNTGYSNRVFLYNNDNRARLDFLTGVKYFLGNNPMNEPPTGADDYAGYGFELFKKSNGGVNILKTDYALGLGCVFDRYITKNEWLSLDYTEREQALMECVVVSDDSEEDGLLHEDVNKISSEKKELLYHMTEPVNMALDDGEDFSEDALKGAKKFQISQINGGFSIYIDEEVKDSEVYVVFRGLKRTPEEGMTSAGNSRLERLRSKVKSSGKDYGDFRIYANNGVITKAALNTVGSVSGFSNIQDFAINMGVQNKGSKEIRVSFNHVGTYTFDDIQVMAVPLSTFRESAVRCMQNSFQTDVIGNNYVSGIVTTTQAKSMLYLSIPYYKGWYAYVDGVETEIQQIDTAYSGVVINGEGQHNIELKYRPVGFGIGLIMFSIGLIAVVLVCVFYHKRKIKMVFWRS